MAPVFLTVIPEETGHAAPDKAVHPALDESYKGSLLYKEGKVFFRSGRKRVERALQVADIARHDMGVDFRGFNIRMAKQVL